MRYILLLTFLIATICIHAQNLEIYVSDAGNFDDPPWQILKFDGNGENPSVFIDDNLNWPQDILFLEDSDIVLISNLGTGRINRHNASTGEFISSFATSIGGPTRMKIGPDGLLYVLQWSGNGRVKRYNLDGSFVDDFTSLSVPQSIGLDWDTEGNLYVSSYSGDFVRKFDTDGINQGLFINTNLVGPTNIWFGTDGELFVADYDGTSVKRFDSNGTYMGNFITGLNNCEGIDFLPNGNILIGNGGTQSVKLYDSNGNYIEDFIPSGSGNLMTPNAVVVRDISTTAVDEIQDKHHSNIFYPTIGLEFFIKRDYIHELRTILLYNYSGKLLESFNTIPISLKIKDKYSEGVYLAKLIFQDGSELTERLIVKKN